MGKIISPRPIYEIEEESIKKHIIKAGTNVSGITIIVDKNGLAITGYYEGFSQEPKKYALLSEPIFINWDDLDKMKERSKSGKRKKELIADSKTPDLDPVSEEYLKTLPIVTMNGKKYYIDGDKKERRLADRPEQVWKY